MILVTLFTYESTLVGIYNNEKKAEITLPISPITLKRNI